MLPINDLKSSFVSDDMIRNGQGQVTKYYVSLSVKFKLKMDVFHVGLHFELKKNNIILTGAHFATLRPSQSDTLARYVQGGPILRRKYGAFWTAL